jgi:hypothetical protein
MCIPDSLLLSARNQPSGKRGAAPSWMEPREMERPIVEAAYSSFKVVYPETAAAEWHFPQENATFHRSQKGTLTLELL